MLDNEEEEEERRNVEKMMVEKKERESRGKIRKLRSKEKITKKKYKIGNIFEDKGKIYKMENFM